MIDRGVNKIMNCIKLEKLNDFFTEINKRPQQGVYFIRINKYSSEIDEFIKQYYEKARQTGVVIEGRIPNPDEKNLAYYSEMMGMEFSLDEAFISKSLKKWLPRMNDYQNKNIAKAIFDVLEGLRLAGKNENILKNVYIKFMCWLYYKFERVVANLLSDNAPKILYEGEISNHELLLISVLSGAGCDVVLLQYSGDDAYMKVDPQNKYSKEFKGDNLQAFPKGYSLKSLRERKVEEINNQRLYGTPSKYKNCTNAWIGGDGLKDVLTDLAIRGNDKSYFYNCFIRVNGVEDKLIYQNDLYQFSMSLKNKKRRYVIVDGTLPVPTMEEIASIKRGNYTDYEQLVAHISSNISYSANIELQRIMVTAFVDIILEESKKPEINVNKLTNKAVYILCWLKRYQSKLFNNWDVPDVACFIHMGGCTNENEALFLRFLSKLPIDVLILNPNLNVRCILEDKMLFEKNYTQSMSLDKFPQSNNTLHIGTAAYHAERELDSLLYQDSGMYRNNQFKKASIISLQTMYEEIDILWDNEMKYRPNFGTVGDTVNLPVIFSKISGIKNGDISKYWMDVKKLITDDTFFTANMDIINKNKANPVKAFATQFLKNGRLQRDVIKQHKCYQYGILREEMQDHLLDKLDELIQERIIKGTFENGMEYTIISVALNLNMEMVRILQKFDFTKKNPKYVYINTTETIISLEDSIMLAYLHLVGFDIVCFIPTGYQSVEKHYAKVLMEEHQIGEFVYDLQIPDFRELPSNTRPSWREKIFKRGT